jgi:hypothetical protein
LVFIFAPIGLRSIISLQSTASEDGRDQRGLLFGCDLMNRSC